MYAALASADIIPSEASNAANSVSIACAFSKLLDAFLIFFFSLSFTLNGVCQNH